MKHKSSGDIIILKGQVCFSQAVNSYHQVELTVNKEDNSIVTVKCDCIASEGKCCSHSAGLAFKVNEAKKKGYIGIACTDESCVWNRCTQEMCQIQLRTFGAKYIYESKKYRGKITDQTFSCAPSKGPTSLQKFLSCTYHVHCVSFLVSYIELGTS